MSISRAGGPPGSAAGRLVDNPHVKVTEAQMFRVVVIVGIAMIPVVLLAALVDPLAAAILFGVEIGIALGVLIQARRRHRASAAQDAVPGPD